VTNQRPTPADDRGSNRPGTVRVKPGGKFIAVRIDQPAAWVVVSVKDGRIWQEPIASYRAGDIYEWPVV
jgi:hypothetical protein